MNESSSSSKPENTMNSTSSHFYIERPGRPAREIGLAPRQTGDGLPPILETH